MYYARQAAVQGSGDEEGQHNGVISLAFHNSFFYLGFATCSLWKLGEDRNVRICPRKVCEFINSYRTAPRLPSISLEIPITVG